MEEYKIDDLSEKGLKWGYWYITHKQQVKKIFTGSLILLCAIIWIKPVYGLIVYLAQIPQDNRIMAGLSRNILDFPGYIEKTKPKEISILMPQVIYTGDNNYDFVAQVTNPNESRGIAELTYQFVSGNFYSPTDTISFLPNQTVYLMSLANESKTRLAEPSLKIINLRWQGIHERISLEDNPIKITDQEFGETAEGSRFRVGFTAANVSLDNYWEVDFQAVLFAGAKIVGVNRITLERFVSGDSRPVELSWFERLPRVSQIEIVPVVDVYDKNNYFTVAGAAVDVR